MCSSGATASINGRGAFALSSFMGRDIASARNLLVVGDRAVGRWSVSVSSLILELDKDPVSPGFSDSENLR